MSHRTKRESRIKKHEYSVKIIVYGLQKTVAPEQVADFLKESAFHIESTPDRYDRTAFSLKLLKK